ncbi:E3 ubiquitin-protein ligase RBBP6-like [Athene noctua]|uniref:E3 ubiquitin-protein ligase RBBP6-like n=1 Tax=Athene noctua TaxID=126797 RepID=UPI003EBA837B
MPCVHYQFFSQLRRDTVTFSGLHISVGNLKREIMGRQKLKAANCDLRVTNAETGEEYTDANALIPKNSSVIVRRVPVRGVKTTSKTPVITRTEPASETSRAIEDSSAAIPLAQLIKLCEETPGYTSTILCLLSLRKTWPLYKELSNKWGKIVGGFW